ncbi:class F sortase [Streptomyces monticola]|uniref:Class F sortase n=1 Tax=Streptomyces monticola TaxID=2666263 RepID=A0ABW2JJF3_9ACTN
MASSSYRVLPRVKAPLAGLTTLGVLIGAWMMAEGVRAQEQPPRPPAAGDARSVGAGGTIAPLPASRPVRIRIPAIQVEAPLMGLSLLPDGSLDVPPADVPQLAGWFQDGTSPGAVGTAVTAGHLDSATGPAVFYRLGAVRPGQTVEVDREDGRTAVFTVDNVELVPGDAFPDAKVYGQSDRPELRVITCGGTYTRATGGYQGNTVVYARLTDVREPTAASPSPAPSWSPTAVAPPSPAPSWSPTAVAPPSPAPSWSPTAVAPPSPAPSWSPTPLTPPSPPSPPSPVPSW